MGRGDSSPGALKLCGFSVQHAELWAVGLGGGLRRVEGSMDVSGVDRRGEQGRDTHRDIQGVYRYGCVCVCVCIVDICIT